VLILTGILLIVSLISLTSLEFPEVIINPDNTFVNNGSVQDYYFPDFDPFDLVNDRF